MKLNVSILLVIVQLAWIFATAVSSNSAAECGSLGVMSTNALPEGITVANVRTCADHPLGHKRTGVQSLAPLGRADKPIAQGSVSPLGRADKPIAQGSVSPLGRADKPIAQGSVSPLGRDDKPIAQGSVSPHRSHKVQDACYYNAPYGCSDGYCWKTCGPSGRGQWCWLAAYSGYGDWMKCTTFEQCRLGSGFACGQNCKKGSKACGCSC